MPQKSIEQYERELMKMYRLAMAKDPDYATLARRRGPAAAQQAGLERISVEIPSPAVEETVPLPRGIEPALTNKSDSSALPTKARDIENHLILPMFPTSPFLSEPKTAPVSDEETADEADAVSGMDVISDQNPAFETADAADAVSGMDVISDQNPAFETAYAEGGEENDDAIGATAIPSIDFKDGKHTAATNMGTGSLSVSVTTKNRTVPVQDAAVKVSRSEGKKSRVVAEAVTDSRGKTELIRLAAPIREIPTYPGPMVGGDLNARYIIDVEAVGFEPVHGEGISIFDGVTSVKRIDLTAEPNIEKDESTAAEG